MAGQRSESELLVLRKLAQELASARNERATSGHLLAAIASRPSLATELLLDRKLGPDILLKAARATSDEEPEPLARAITRAKEVATRCGATAPNALHLLIALVNDRSSGAHRALAQCGIDVARLRTSAMQMALGLVGPRRISAPVATAQPQAPSEGRARTATSAGRAPAPSTRPPPKPLVGVPIPVVPEIPPLRTPRVAMPVPTSPPVAPAAPTVTARKKAIAVPVQEKPASVVLALDPKRFPTLAAVGKNLTLAAAEGALEPVIGRDGEMDQILDILAKRDANNACLLGLPGVGKTAIVRGLAHRIAARARDGLGGTLDDRILVEIPIAEVVAASPTRSALAERISALRNEAREAKGRVVLFFDDVHLLGELGEEVTGDLKLSLARGELPCIGATTPEDFRRVFETDASLSRAFTIVEVEEPSQDEAFAVLRAAATGLERHHSVEFEDRAIASAVAWSVRYLPGRALPDKAVGILDFAGARARRRSLRAVGPDAVAEIVSELGAIPIERLLATDRDRMLALETILAERVVGHSEALAKIARILRRNAVGLRGKRPIGTFLLLGPTGVGKTETAKAIAEALFHSADAMTRIDLGEYSESHSVARLIGAPPGYLGHEAGGQLTEAVRKRPYQVILLDEIEKAHRDVLETFLGVFDEGRLTDGRGKTVDFTNTVIVLTSNLGAAEAQSRATRGIGFGRGSEKEMAAKACEAVIAAARAALPPELYNRIDEVLAFAPLGRSDVAEVARRLLAGLSKDLEEARDLRLDVDEAAIEALLDAGGFDPSLGARPMRRTIARLVEAPLADLLLRSEIEAGDVVLVTAENGEIVLDHVRPANR